MLQWPCNELLNALLATSTTKINCLHRKLFPLPRQKKKKKSGSDDGKIALHTIPRIRNFFIAQETK